MAGAIVLNPTHGKVGSSTLITGTGFTAGDTMTFTFAGNPITPTEAPIIVNGDGTLPTCHIVIPQSVQGAHAVVGTDGHAVSGSANFTTDPSISLNPTTGKVGDTVTITADGFANASAVTTTFAGAGVTTSPAAPQGNASGHWTATFVIPAAIHGNNTVSCTDAAANNATAVEAVIQNATIDPSAGPAGELLTIIGTGFDDASVIGVTINGVTKSFVSPVTSDASGGFTGSLQLATDLAQGVYTIVVIDEDSNTFTLTFTVNADLVISVTITNPNRQYARLAGGVIDEENIPVANDNYVTVGMINMIEYIRASFEMYNPHASQDYTFSIQGLIDDSSGVTPDPASTKWLGITGITDIDVTHLSGKLAEVTSRYSWLKILVKRKTSGASHDSTMNIYGKLQAF